MNVSNNKFILFINRIEDGLLVLILAVMIVLAVFQVVSRNLFAEGAVWIDPLLRMLVLWVGLTGAVVATRTDNHIRIDILNKYLPVKLLPHVHRLVYLFTLSICLLISWHAARFVYSEYEYGTMAFASIPAWVAAIIIPISFLLIAVRYFLLLFTPHVLRSVRDSER
ncbi:MAG: TRAP transporter small permease subunit [Gammaproteobacteria bacterium]|jgi:TRAP-type C4-dicarboxylate transport system permease small subunit|nr:TRAP transporter small permease subunit [Gammaproteobacteria bacterium]